MRYAFTLPVDKNGKADFFVYLENIANGEKYTGTRVRDRMHKYLTFASLKERGLIEYTAGAYRITSRGQMYVGIVNSTNKVPKDVLKYIMDA